MHSRQMRRYTSLLLSLMLRLAASSEPRDADFEFVSLPPLLKHSRPSRPATTYFLNEKTRPFAVNGSRLPLIDFDIGEIYAGFLPIDQGDDEYFFFFDPALDPDRSSDIVIWLNGGPGASSLSGMLQGNGPFTWTPSTHAPVPNMWAWSNLTNIVWVDQPTGTGYSNGLPSVTSQDDIAMFFLSFWKHFVELFDLHQTRVFIAGESYAGRYVPYIADAMLAKREKTFYNMAGILLYNAGIGTDMLQTRLALSDFASRQSSALALNETFAATIKATSKSCGYDTYNALHNKYPPAGPFPPPPSVDSDGHLIDGCGLFEPIFLAARDLNPCFNLYQVAQACPIPFDPLGFPYSGHYLPPDFPRPYLDLPTVKAALHVPWNYTWTSTSPTYVFVDGQDRSPPPAIAPLPGTTGPLQRVIEQTNNVLIVNGDLDMAVPTEGTLAVLQNLTWNGAQGFDERPTADIWVPKADIYVQEHLAGTGSMGKWISQRGLTFARVFRAGHQVPRWTPSVAFRQLEVLLGRRENLSDRRGFSSQE